MADRIVTGSSNNSKIRTEAVAVWLKELSWVPKAFTAPSNNMLSAMAATSVPMVMLPAITQ